MYNKSGILKELVLVEKIIVNEQNKEYVKSYYVNRYLNNIECNDLDANEYRESIEKLVDDAINEFLKTEDDSNFSDKMSKAYQNYIQKYKIKRFGTSDMFLLAKEDPKYYENLYKYYENLLVLNIGLNQNKVDSKIIEQAKILLKDSFNKINILDINDFKKIRSKIGNINSMILFKLNIRTNNANSRNKNIEANDGSLDEKENLKEHFKYLYLSRIDGLESLLPKEKLKTYIEHIIDKLIENYFSSKHTSSLSNYLSSQTDRLLKSLNKDITLIRYARIINNKEDCDYAINYYVNKYKYILESYDAPHILIGKYREIIEKYIRDIRLNTNIELYLKTNLNKAIKENAINSISFDLDIARGSNEIERQRHRHILLTDFEYKIDLYKERYKFYDNEKIVDKKLKEIYINVIDSYINGISNVLTNRYISTVLKQRFESYAKNTEKKNFLASIILIVNSYVEVLEEYYNEHTLTYTEKGNLEEYMNILLEEYIEKGCYKDDHKEYFREMIKNYEDIDKTYVYENKTF